MAEDIVDELNENNGAEFAAPEPEQQAYAQQPQQAYAQQPQQVYAQQPATVITTGGGDQPSALVAYLLWFFLGWIGIHHLYVGRGVGIWIVSLITFQGLGFWWIADLFLIPASCSMVRGQQTIIVA